MTVAKRTSKSVKIGIETWMHRGHMVKQVCCFAVRVSIQESHKSVSPQAGQNGLNVDKNLKEKLFSQHVRCSNH